MTVSSPGKPYKEALIVALSSGAVRSPKRSVLHKLLTRNFLLRNKHFC
jgi:hypothetical protein